MRLAQVQNENASNMFGSFYIRFYVNGEFRRGFAEFKKA